MTLSPIDPTNEVAVSDYLTKARDWLSRAVDETGPQQIAAAKAEIATAAEATKQLGLSKEIQDDAKEMVRRAEYALAKSIRKGQAEGTVLSDATKGGRRDVDHPDIARPVTDFAARGELYGSQRATGILDAADSAPEQTDFDAALDAARAEGNLSRANVARKAREASGATAPARRAPLPDAFQRTAYDLGKRVESLHRLVSDDRWTQNAEKVAAIHRNDLLRINDLLQQVIDSLPARESTHA